MYQMFTRTSMELLDSKLPKKFIFIPEPEFPRSTTGKIMHHLLEERLDTEG